MRNFRCIVATEHNIFEHWFCTPYAYCQGSTMMSVESKTNDPYRFHEHLNKWTLVTKCLSLLVDGLKKSGRGCSRAAIEADPYRYANTVGAESVTALPQDCHFPGRVGGDGPTTPTQKHCNLNTLICSFLWLISVGFLWTVNVAEE